MSRKRKPSNKKFYSSNRKDFSFWGRPLISRGNRAGKSWINDLIMNNKGEQKIKPSKAWADEVASLSIFESSKKGIYIDESELNKLPTHRYAWSIGVDLASAQSDCHREVSGVKADINNL